MLMLTGVLLSVTIMPLVLIAIMLSLNMLSVIVVSIIILGVVASLSGIGADLLLLARTGIFNHWKMLVSDKHSSLLS